MPIRELHLRAYLAANIFFVTITACTLSDSEQIERHLQAIDLSDPYDDTRRNDLEGLVDVARKATDDQHQSRYVRLFRTYSSPSRLSVEEDSRILMSNPPPQEQTVAALQAWRDKLSPRSYFLDSDQSLLTAPAALLRLLATLRPEELNGVSNDVLMWIYVNSNDANIQNAIGDVWEYRGFSWKRLRQALTVVAWIERRLDAVLFRANLKLIHTLQLGTQVSIPFTQDSMEILRSFKKPTSKSEIDISKWSWVPVTLLGEQSDKTDGIYLGEPSWQRVRSESQIARTEPILDSPIAIMIVTEGQPVMLCGFRAKAPGSLFVNQLQTINPKLFEKRENGWYPVWDDQRRVQATETIGVLSRFDVLEDLNLALVLQFAKLIGMETVTIMSGDKNIWTGPNKHVNEAHMTVEKARRLYDAPAQRAGGKVDENANWRIDLSDLTPIEARLRSWKEANSNRCTNSTR